MANDAREFDPKGEHWSYILDDHSVIYHHPLTAPRLRVGWWPFAREGREYTSHWVRLSPDWCFYSWGPDYVLAGPVGGDEPASLIACEIHLGNGAPDWTRSKYDERVTIRLDLAAKTHEILWPAAGPRSPAQVAEATHKAGKLLAYLTAECARRDEAGSTRPVTAADVADALPTFRFTDHKNARGKWCRFSLCSVTRHLHESDDQRCPHGCPGSSTEEVPAA
jgi:hypothetical protein